MLWGDRGEAQARRSLSQELYRLRGLLPAEGLVLGKDTVRLAPDALNVDVARFERCTGAGDADAAGDAAALYTGALLAGQESGEEGFDAWLQHERGRLHERAVEAWHNVVRARLDGPAELATEAASRLLALDPTNEQAHRALM